MIKFISKKVAVKPSAYNRKEQTMWKAKFKDVVDTLESDEYQILYDENTITVPQSEDGFIELEPGFIAIPKFGIELHQGIFWQKYNDNEFYPDWDLTSINKIGNDPSEILYYEQGGYYSTLHNFLTMYYGQTINTENLDAIVDIKTDPELKLPVRKMKEHY